MTPAEIGKLFVLTYVWAYGLVRFDLVWADWRAFNIRLVTASHPGMGE